MASEPAAVRRIQALRAALPATLIGAVPDADIAAKTNEILWGERSLLVAAGQRLVTRREAALVLLNRLHVWLVDRAGGGWVAGHDPPEDVLRNLEDAIFERET